MPIKLRPKSKNVSIISSKQVKMHRRYKNSETRNSRLRSSSQSSRKVRFDTSQKSLQNNLFSSIESKDGQSFLSASKSKEN